MVFNLIRSLRATLGSCNLSFSKWGFLRGSQIKPMCLQQVSLQLQNTEGKIERVFASLKLGFFDRLFGHYVKVKIRHFNHPLYFKVSQLQSVLNLTPQKIKSSSEDALGTLLLEKKQELDTKLNAAETYCKTANMLQILVSNGLLTTPQPIPLPDLTSLQERVKFIPPNLASLCSSGAQGMASSDFTALLAINKIISLSLFEESLSRLAARLDVEKRKLIFKTLVAIGNKLTEFEGRNIPEICVEGIDGQTLGYVITPSREIFIQGAYIAQGSFKMIWDAIPLQSREAFVWASVQDVARPDAPPKPPEPEETNEFVAYWKEYLNLCSGGPNFHTLRPPRLNATPSVARGAPPLSARKSSLAPSEEEPSIPAETTVASPPPAGTVEGSDDTQSEDSISSNENNHGPDGAKFDDTIPDAKRVPQSNIGEALEEQRMLIEMSNKCVLNIMPPYKVTVVIGGEGTGRVRKLVMIQTRLNGTLGTVLKDIRAGRLSMRNVLQASRDVAQGLASMHADANQIHVDVKPENVLISRGQDGTLRARLHDFGSSKRNGEQIESASPVYLPPEGVSFSAEQIHLGLATPAIDSFSLGVALFEMITGTAYYYGLGDKKKNFCQFKKTEQALVDEYISKAQEAIRINRILSILSPEDKAIAIKILGVCKKLMHLNTVGRMTCGEAFQELST